MNDLTLSQRANHYNIEYPDYPPLNTDSGWLYGVWMIGNNYQNKNDYYGEYPPTYLDRVKSLFPDRENPLHLFSGSLKPDQVDNNAVRVDIKKEVNPDIVMDCEKIGSLDTEFDLIMADPPYTEEDAEEYGTGLPNRNEVVMNQVPEILESGGFLVWLDLRLPMYRKDDYNFCGTIELVRSTNHRFRGISIFERK